MCVSGKGGKLHLSVVKQRNNGSLLWLCEKERQREGGIVH